MNSTPRPAFTFHLTDRRTGKDLAQTFATAAEAGQFLQTLGADATHYDVTRRQA